MLVMKFSFRCRGCSTEVPNRPAIDSYPETGIIKRLMIQAQRVCLLLQYLLQSCSRGGRGIVEDMCYEKRRAEACVD
jgi:hypothetical protein